MRTRLNQRWTDALGSDVHVWPVGIGASAGCLERSRALLSPDELERASRFRFDHLQNAYTITHGCLRALLGRYLAAPPAAIRFQYGARGKPAIAGPATDLQFNLSHSAGVALIAVASGLEVGADVEEVHPLQNMEDIAKQFFSSEESSELLGVPPAFRETAFFQAWTRKEAYIKAVGDGFHIPLDSFRVTLRCDEDARLVHLGGDAEAARPWQMHTLCPAPGFLGAVAYRGERRQGKLFGLMDASELLDIAAAGILQETMSEV